MRDTTASTSFDATKCAGPATRPCVYVTTTSDANYLSVNSEQSVERLNIAAPRLVSAIISPMFDFVRIKFDSETDKGIDGLGDVESFVCTTLFDFINKRGDIMPAANTLGAGSRCIWEDAKTVLMSLGRQPSLIPGWQLKILPNPATLLDSDPALRKANCKCVKQASAVGLSSANFSYATGQLEIVAHPNAVRVSLLVATCQ